MVAGEVVRQREDRRVGSVSTLAELLPRAAAHHGDRVAVVGGHGHLDYRDVDAAARSVAAQLRSRGVRHGDHVVLMMHKTTDSFVIVHAVLRLGAVVVPIDPLMPVPALTALVSTVRPRGIVVDAPSLPRLASVGAAVDLQDVVRFSPDVVDDNVHSLRSAIDEPAPIGEDSDADVQPDDPAYVIFTSGSTGAPKGITHTHRSGLAYAELAVEEHRIDADDRLAGLPPLHFDMSTLELYAAPLVGASVVPFGTAELRFPAGITERSATESITVWYAVPFQLRQISERGALDQRDLSALRHVIYAGEPFSASALATLMAHLPGVRFSNAYGPAETNVVTVHELDAPPIDAVPIGRPWGNVEVMVVDPALDRPTPEDDLGAEQGELLVSAPTTMDGYLGQPGLTHERIVIVGGRRWYRTGDLVVRDVDGSLRLAGRVDHQVKVRGTRIELEAVEAVLADHPQIADAVVAPVRSGIAVDSLRAVVTLADDVDQLDQAAVHRWCRARLSSVAVPVDIATWSVFPLTSSGKIDRGRVRSALDATGESREDGHQQVPRNDQ